MTPDTDIEWRPVAGYEETYSVSSTGLVRSHPRHGTLGGILRPHQSKWGYMNVLLTQNSKPWTVTVHLLVARAFLGPRPEGMETRHLDGDPTNNHASNLRYGTKSENARDRIRHGNHSNASKTHCKNGHPFDEENTGRAKGGRERYCRICKRENAVAHWRAVKAARATSPRSDLIGS
jgi:hypothetical protein